MLRRASAATVELLWSYPDFDSAGEFTSRMS
jgi:hypothetical protein